jgi:hypothetical protein
MTARCGNKHEPLPFDAALGGQADEHRPGSFAVGMIELGETNVDLSRVRGRTAVVPKLRLPVRRGEMCSARVNVSLEPSACAWLTPRERFGLLCVPRPSIVAVLAVLFERHLALMLSEEVQKALVF